MVVNEQVERHSGDDVELSIDHQWFTAVYENDTPQLATLSEADPELLFAKEKVRGFILFVPTPSSSPPPPHPPPHHAANLHRLYLGVRTDATLVYELR